MPRTRRKVAHEMQPRGSAHELLPRGCAHELLPRGSPHELPESLPDPATEQFYLFDGYDADTGTPNILIDSVGSGLIDRAG